MEANERPTPRHHDLASLQAEARTLDLIDGDDLHVAGLDHNPLNTITGSIDRLEWDGGAAVRKVVTPRGEGAAHWAASQDPTAWNFWQREVLAYRTGLPARLGLDAPALLGAIDLDDGSVALWLEAVEGASGDTIGVEGLARAARAVGRAQAQPSPADDAWLSRGFIADYAASKPADHGLYDDDHAWAHPLVTRNWDPAVRAGCARLWHQRHRFHAILAALPRRICHLDLWPNNIVVRSSGSPALLDWSFVGDGALGEDIGNLIPDAVLDLLVPAAAIDDLERAVFSDYVEGLREGGWDGPSELIRLAMTASAVKYHWLAPTFLARCDAPVHYAYGRETDPDVLYAERGVALERLADWGAEALRLADELGVAIGAA